MGDKKAVYTLPIYFGYHCYIGDEMLRRQYLQDMDRTAAAVTEVAVTPGCDDQRCSFWTPFNSPPDKSAGNGDEKDSKSELGGGTHAGPAKSELGGGNTQAGPVKSELGGGNTQAGPVKSELGGGNTQAGPVKIELGVHTQTGLTNSELGDDTRIGPSNAMGPLNIMAAIIPFESTWPTDDVDHLSMSSEGSVEFHFDDDDDEWV